MSTKDLEAIRKKLDKLYHDAAVATDAYNAADEKTEKQSAQIVELARAIVEGQEKLDRPKDRAGAAARAQYRSGGLPPEAQLMRKDMLPGDLIIYNPDAGHVVMYIGDSAIIHAPGRYGQ